ncbi:hypothetical protein ACQ4PT_002765 [Festuca glaucescens]
MRTATPVTGSLSQAPSSSERSDRKRKRRKRKSRPTKPREKASTEAAAGRTISEDEEAKRKKLEAEEEEAVSSAPSSPLRQPRLPGHVTDGWDDWDDGDDADQPPALIQAFKHARLVYDEKLLRQEEMLTLKYCGSTSMFFDPELLPVMGPATDAVLLAARFVLGLSSSLDGQGARKRCSGFWIDWDKENKTGIVLTTAHLFSSKGCSVEQEGEGVEEEYARHGEVKYYPHAKVTVHLPDGSAAVGHLIYHQEHYDLAFFRVRVDQPVLLPSFNDGVKCGQLVFWLGSDANVNITMTHLRPGYYNANMCEKPHHMFFPGKERTIKYDNGGPIIDLDAKVVGMINIHRSGSFISSSVLFECLDLWKKFKSIPRPHLGLWFSGIKLLDLVRVEKLWQKYKIDDGLIVEEV